MNKLLIAAFALANIGIAAPALAEPSCDVNREEWQTEQALRDKLGALRWTIKNVKIDNGCYEVYGADENGKRVEIYFNPKTLEAVPGQGG